MILEKTETDHVTRSAAHLSVIEIFFGSLIHSLKIPMGGHLLSINQGAFLCRSSSLAPSRTMASKWAYEISGVSATLKSLSPAGNKLGPMLSISMQGLLYALGNLVAGHGLIGQSLGMIFLSAWAFFQPFITLWISFGTTNVHAALESFGSFLVAVILFKMAICALVPFILKNFSPERLEQIENKIIVRAKTQNATQAKTGLSAAHGALHDMTRPLFVISFILMILFLGVRSAGLSTLVWLSLRPLAIAFIIFYLLRSPIFMNWLSAQAEKFAPLRAIHARAVKAQAYLEELNR